ncbi:MAG TPA: M13 family metallopeptidase [Usitatibacter sp.]|nr:M13 family metallopeptidase [Usitatibacter sp.]
MKRFILRPLVAAVLACLAAPAAAVLDVAGIDKSVDACTNFYEHVNGRWIKATPIPDDRTSWGTGAMIDKANETILVAALDEALKKPLPAAGTPQRKALEYYKSGMDTAAIEKAGLTPLEPVMQRIGSVGNPAELARTLGYLHTLGIGAGFAVGVQQDAKESTRYLFQLAQGGLGLPERDYYFKDDEKSKQQREAYLKHVARMLELSGTAPDVAAKQAATIFAMESELARSSMTRVELRDDEKTYHKRTMKELAAQAPGLPWAEYFKAIGGTHLVDVNMGQPEFFKTLGRLAKERPAADWQAYMRWHTLKAAAGKLPAAFHDESFAFYERLLKGRKAQPPRFRHVVNTISGPYGNYPMAHALGRIYVERAFPPEAKARMVELVRNVKAALGDRLRTLDWMGPETRTRALEKLAAMEVKVGYPDKWRDYSKADVGAYSFVENWMRANQYDMAYDLAKIGKPIDRTEWWMAPNMVNAYYDPSKNEIVFPAGILQPPLFDLKADDAVNYGGIGMVIGHEITHGFDDTGRKYDAQGNLKDWWTAEDAKRYEARAKRMAKQYSGFPGPDNLKVNGELTLGENISDLGGLQIAYGALQKALRDKPQGPIDGYTPEQRFFLSFAQAWRNATRPEQERMRILTDTHSPPRYRVMGPIAHMPEFAKAFSCDPDKSLLADAERANIW